MVKAFWPGVKIAEIVNEFLIFKWMGNEERCQSFNQISRSKALCSICGDPGHFEVYAMTLKDDAHTRLPVLLFLSYEVIQLNFAPLWRPLRNPICFDHSNETNAFVFHCTK